MGWAVMRREGAGLGAPVDVPGVHTGGLDWDCCGLAAGATEATVSSAGGTFILPMYFEFSGLAGWDFVPVWTLFPAEDGLLVWA